MGRPNTGPKLVFEKQKGNNKGRYYIRWTEGRQKRQRSTGTSNREEAENELQIFLAQRARKRRGQIGPSDPNEILIADCLDDYGREHAPSTADPGRIGCCLVPLIDFFGPHTVSKITTGLCKAYYRARIKQLSARFPARAENSTPSIIDPARPSCFDATIRRELGTLAASLKYCAKEGYLSVSPPIWLPPKKPPKERWLTRKEVAALLWAAKSEPKARFHLPLFILLGLYTGARKASILTLQWQPNTSGGWVDLDRGVIDFNAVGRIQTKKRRSKIPIPRRLLTFLKFARKRTRQFVIEADGQSLNDIKRSFSTAAKKARTEEVTPHTLCHTSITWMVQSGVPLWEVAGYAGRSEEVIVRTYGHHSPDYMQRAAQSWDYKPLQQPLQQLSE